MFFTDTKATTLREARAESIIKMKPETLALIREGKIPKGNVLELARTAGVLAAKKVPELIPYCHPLPLDGVAVDFELHDDSIKITSQVKVIWKTGVEMEALTAVTVAALTIYDMCKPVDKEMEIVSTKLVSKTGGKSNFKEKISKNLKAAVVVTSDGTSQGTREDKSGKIILERLKNFGLTEVEYVILPDDREAIRNELIRLIEKGALLIITTGGTGLGPRDVTVEATREIIDREVPGIAEAMREFGQGRTPYAMLSRGIVGVKGKTLIMNLPGSSKGTEESLNAVFPAVFHAYPMMGGEKH